MFYKSETSHPNRGLHNWVFYRLMYQSLENSKQYLRGDVIDLGCGNAAYKQFILNLGLKYIGIDWSKSLHLIKADIIADLNCQLPLMSSSIDSLISISVLEHLHDPFYTLSEINRVLKNDGHFLMQIPWQWQVHESPNDYYRLTPHAIEKFLKDAGFLTIDIKPQSGFFTMQVLKFNYFTRRFITGNRIKRYTIKSLLVPLWTIGQILSPLLDKLDKKWELETIGYFIIAKKNDTLISNLKSYYNI